MSRRKFMTLLGGAAVAWPVAAHAQQPAMPVVGFLRVTCQAKLLEPGDCVPTGLKEAGFVEGQNVTIEYRWAAVRTTGFRHWQKIWSVVRSAMIVGHSSAAQAAKAASTTTPVIFVVGADPLERAWLPISIGRAAT